MLKLTPAARRRHSLTPRGELPRSLDLISLGTDAAAARGVNVLAAEGCVSLMERLWSALEHIDTSSGALGGAVQAFCFLGVWLSASA